MVWVSWSDATVSVDGALSSAVRSTGTCSFFRSACTAATSGASEAAP